MIRVLAAVALVWIIGCLVVAGFALARGQFFLTFGLVIAALAPLPLMSNE